MKKNKKIIISICFLFFSLFFGQVCLAGMLNSEGIAEQAAYMAAEAGFDGNDPETQLTDTVSTAIRAFLSFLGVIFIILMLYGGFTWMTAGGDEGKVETAKKTIQRAVIGLLVIVSAYAITYSIFKVIE